MSGDLISRSAFEKFIKEKYKDGENTDDIKDQMLFDLSYQPTAYNVDKVVGQLEEKALEHAENGHQYGADGWRNHASKEYAKRDGYYEAIEIVKAGGVE